MGGVLTGGREAFVACRQNFKPLACLVAEISAEKSFTIVTVSQGPTIGFRCEPAVCGDIYYPLCYYQNYNILTFYDLFSLPLHCQQVFKILKFLVILMNNLHIASNKITQLAVEHTAFAWSGELVISIYNTLCPPPTHSLLQFSVVF